MTSSAFSAIDSLLSISLIITPCSANGGMATSAERTSSRFKVFRATSCAFEVISLILSGFLNQISTQAGSSSSFNGITPTARAVFAPINELGTTAVLPIAPTSITIPN
jgi:hypothetical protein